MPAFDLLIRDAFVVDGSGLPGRRADVGIRDGRFAAIGRLAGETGSRVLDADGQVVAPGIIDLHTHYDPQLMFEPFATPSSHHGVTTVVAGNCGFSLAPCRESDRDFQARLFAKVEGMAGNVLDGIAWDFETFPDYLDRREGRLGVNLACYVGHTSVRRWVMGEDASERAATDDEVAKMCRLVDEAMAAGAAGFSSAYTPAHSDDTGRPIPSRLGSPGELLALVETAGRSHAGSLAFVPGSIPPRLSEDDEDLMISMSLRSGLPVVTQGLGGRSKVAAPDDGPALEAFFAKVRRAGASVYSLLRIAPFDRVFTLAQVQRASSYEGVPSWQRFLKLPLGEKLAALRDPTTRDEMRWAVEDPNLDASVGSTQVPPPWEHVFVQAVRDPRHRPLVGRTVTALAEERGCAPADAMLDLALAEDLETEFRALIDDPGWAESVGEWQRHDNMLIGVSDGGAHLDRDDGSRWSTYFLATWARDRGTWSLEEAIRQITAVPAAVAGLDDVGQISVGRRADAFLFDLEALGLHEKRLTEDFPGGAARFQCLPTGISATIVGGQVAIDEGQLTGELAGAVLRPSGSRARG